MVFFQNSRGLKRYRVRRQEDRECAGMVAYLIDHSAGPWVSSLAKTSFIKPKPLKPREIREPDPEDEPAPDPPDP